MTNFKIKSLLAMFFPLIISGTTIAQTYLPKSYYAFENSTTPMKDSMGSFNLDPNYYGSAYTINNNAANVGVGKYLSLNSTGNLIRCGQVPLDSGFTLEVMFRPGYNFNTTTMFKRMDGAVNIWMGYPYITFATEIKATNGSTIYDELTITFEGIGRKSYGYLMDGGWHQLVFRYNATTGAKELWIDGELPAGFSKTTGTGRFNTASSNTEFTMNTTVSYYRYQGDYDELAIYQYPLNPNMIYKHYQNIQAHQHYSFAYTSTPPPTPSPVSGSVDLQEYPPGHPSSISVDAVTQMQSFPLARYKPGHTLLRNYSWINLMMLGGRFRPGITDAQSVTRSVTLNSELATNWNYILMCSLEPDAWGTAWTALANQNPQWPTSATMSRAQVPNANIWNQNLSSSHYIQNSSGQFLDEYGSVTSGTKKWRPTSPVADYVNDGLYQKSRLQTLMNSLTRPLNYINENGEVFPLLSQTAMQSDPQVLTDKNSSGLDWDTYLARRMKDNETGAYRDQFMGLSQLANTKFTEYGLDGAPQYRMKWSEIRSVNSQINGQYYSTGDFYVRYPNNWRTWIGAWHGWQWIVDCRYNELAVGDKYFSPFLSAGWDLNEENNVRPAQWLGLLKLLNMAGAEFFYPGYFSYQSQYGGSNPPPADPGAYVWQAIMPCYAQGILSRYEDLFRNGSLMNGDVPNSYYSGTQPNAPSYSFWTGDLRKLVVIRKHNTLAKYAITGTIQPNSNMAGNAELESNALITLDGQQLKFKVRRQGSTYIYDKTSASSPVFYQLDEWHESSYPYYWTKDFKIEAELFDNTNSNIILKTSVPAGTAAGDYTNYSTYTTFNAVSDAIYNFQPRATVGSYYVWVYARSRTGQSTGMSVTLDANAAKQIGCIADTVWRWYRYDVTSNQPIVFSNLSLANHQLKITPTNTYLEVDKIHLSFSSNAIYSGTNPCSAASVPVITPGGSTTFCQGGSVTLTSSSANSYSWSTGATTQAITVNTSGTYTVTVTTASGTATSSPVTVTVNSLPTASITAGGATSFCQGGSVVFTASSGSSYLWSNGATTQAVTLTASGNYSVTVYNSSGCSATSPAKSVTVSATPTATITAGGATTFCQGGNVTLTSSLASSYLWSPGNQTTQSITVNSSGSYTVKVTVSGGCTANSSATAVTVNALPSALITPNGPTTFNQGGSVTLTASSGGASYLWSPGGQTTQAITVGASGSYSVLVTSVKGCTATSLATLVTVLTSTLPTITASGATTFCEGGSVTLTASAGTSYLWSNGATTQSIVVTTSGTFTVAVTNGLVATSLPTIVTVNTNPLPVVSANGSTTFCQGGSVTLSSIAAYSYLWSPGGQTTQSVSVSSTGSYSVKITNSAGCSANSSATSVVVNSNPVATISASGPTTFNQGGSVTLTSSTGSSYLWSPGGQTTKSITVTTSGNYSVKVINSSGCFTQSSATNVTVNPNSGSAVITASGPTSFCQGGNVTLTASSGTAYQWSTGATTQSIVVSTSGSYVCTVSYGLFNQATTSPTVVTVNALPSANNTASGATTFCAGGSVTLNAVQSGVSYLWTPGNLTTQSIVVTTSGSYVIKVTNAAGCSATSTPTVVTVNNCNGCPVPIGLSTSNIASTSAKLNWSAMPVIGYIVKLRNLSTGVNYYTGQLAASAISITVGVNSNTNYRWWIRSVCSTTSKSPWSSSVDFTTLPLRTLGPIENGETEPMSTEESGISLSDITVFPNPTSSVSTVSLVSYTETAYDLMLTDITGKVVRNEKWECNEGLNLKEIDLSLLPKGVYSVMVRVKDEIKTKRIIVQ